MKRRLAAAVTALLVAALSVSAQTPQPAVTFRHERPIVVSAPGPQRLALDATLLAGTQPVTIDPPSSPDRRLVRSGPPDLRLYTGAGIEVPYLFVPPPVQEQLAAAPLRVPVAFERRETEPGRSRFHVTLPAGRLPITALDLTIGGGNLLRDVRVLEATLTRNAAPAGPQVEPAVIGSTQLKRAIGDGATAEALRVNVLAPNEPDLELVFDDGDNPPVDLQGVTAVFAELPWLYFESPPGTLTARFGDPKAQAPRYDLEAVRGQIPERLSEATWGPETAGSIDAGTPPALLTPSRGAALTLDDFAFVRQIPSGPQGLIVVPLDAAAFAHSASEPRGFRDVRILDADGFQVPYLLEKRDERLTHDLRLESRDPVTVTAGGGTRSAYRVPLPFPDIWRSELVLTTRARVFRRTVRIGVLPPADRQGRVRFQPTDTRSWNQSDENTAARPLTLPVPSGSRGEVVLEIDEGDNQPLPIERATLLVPSYAVRFFRSGPSPLRLAYGRPDLASPQYDLSLLASQVMGQRAVQVDAGPERRPDGSDPAASRSSTAPLSAAAFWAVLGLAVVVLLGVVVRLVRRET